MQFYIVYIREAHALDSAMPSAHLAIEDPISAEERTEVCVRCIEDLKIPIPAVIDDMSDSVNRAYGAFPDRLYLVGRNGKIAFAGEPGPRGFSPDQWEQAIVAELEGRSATQSLLLTALDRDGDGALSAEELSLATESLKRLDKNGDGKLSAEELRGGTPSPEPVAGRDPNRGGGGRGMFDEMDKDGDGKLSREELPARMQPRFSTMDANEDGFVSPEEMRAMMDRRRGQGGRSRGRGERPGGG